MTAAILAADEVTGVTIMEVVRALDAGPMVAKAETAIGPHDTTGSLESRLAGLGAGLLVQVLDDWAAGKITPEPQDDALSTYAPMVRRVDARLDWTLPAVELWRRVRAYNPWPVAFTTQRGEELRVLEAWPLEGDSGAAPGTVLERGALPVEAGAGTAPLVQTGSGRLALVTVQRPGKRALAGQEFLRGQRDFVGSVLG